MLILRVLTMSWLYGEVILVYLVGPGGISSRLFLPFDSVQLLLPVQVPLTEMRLRQHNWSEFF